MEKQKRRWGDRHDGWKLRKSDAMFKLIPYIMRSRMDSQIFFEEDIDIAPIEKYVRQKRAEGMTNLRMLHVFMAGAIRMIAKNPALNRFVAGKNMYARSHMRVSLAVKRSMSVEAEETTLTPFFDPQGTIFDVMKILEEEIGKNVGVAESSDNATDEFAAVLKKIPRFILQLVVSTARTLDKIGLMPKAIFDASPFHSSIFITDIGSIGIDAVYHHLYEFGTTSIFMAMGKKKTIITADTDGTPIKKRIITLRFVLDERICDGFYYSSAIRQYKRLLARPEQLEQPMEDVPMDPWI